MWVWIILNASDRKSNSMASARRYTVYVSMTKCLEAEVEFPMGLTSKGLNVPKACDFPLAHTFSLSLSCPLACSLSLSCSASFFLGFISDSLRSPQFSLNCVGHGRQCSDWSGLSHVIELKSPKLDGLGERGFCYEEGWIRTGWWAADCAIMNAPICQLNIHTRTLLLLPVP